METVDIHDAVLEEIERELQAGERLLWSGQPLTKIVFHPSDWTAVPFSLMWGGFSLFWETGALNPTHGSHRSSGIVDLFFPYGVFLS